MTMDGPSAPQQRPRWLYAALIASLAANLLIAGWVGGAMWHHRKDPTWRGGGEPGLMGFVRQLPEERRPAVRQRLKAAREVVRPLKTELDAAWTAANAALTTEPFDKAATKAAFMKAIEADARLRGTIDDELIATAEGLSADERKILQSWREKRKPWMLRHHGRKDKERRQEQDKSTE
ncbi:MAG: periplasmic heavy metal sensor [Hyphomicrobium sp.]